MDVGTREFQEAFVADFVRFGDRPVVMDLSVASALTVVAQLQLALRHPANTGPSAGWTRGFIETLIGKLAVTETMRRGLEAGFDPAHDVPRTPEAPP